MLLSWCLYVNSVLLCAKVLAYASFLPRDNKHSSMDKSLMYPNLPQHPSLQGSDKRRDGSVTSTDIIMKRDDNESDDLRVRVVRILTTSVPITTAAHSLEYFYNAILLNALNPWCSQPPQQVLFITMGPLQLSMTILFDGGVRQGIPWDFVRNFARNMRAVTALGFTGTYDMYYARQYGVSLSGPGLVVEVRFRILWRV